MSQATLGAAVLFCFSLLTLQLSGCSATSRQQQDILYLAIGASDALALEPRL
jgi:hypothetical protein